MSMKKQQIDRILENDLLNPIEKISQIDELLEGVEINKINDFISDENLIALNDKCVEFVIENEMDEPVTESFKGINLYTSNNDDAVDFHSNPLCVPDEILEKTSLDEIETRKLYPCFVCFGYQNEKDSNEQLPTTTTTKAMPLPYFNSWYEK